MRPIGIVSALPAEARALGPSAPHGAELRRLDEGGLLAVSGMGRAAAAAAARRLVLAGAGGLASFGMAGGLDPTLICGTVLLPEEIAVADDGAVSDILPTSRDWRQRLGAVIPASCLVCVGRLLTSARPIGRPDAKTETWRHTGAVAVDMESAAVAQVAGQAGLPFIALRVIVDTATDELPAAVIAASEGGRLRVGRLIGGLLRAPADVGALIRLSARYRIASRVLAAVGAADSPARRALLSGPDAEMS